MTDDSTPSAPLRRAATARFFDPVDVASIAIFRIAFGITMLGEVYLNYPWISAMWQDTTVLFTYDGFGWVRPWPGEGLQIHFVVLAVVSFFVLIGFAYRASATLLFFSWTYLFLLDKSFYQNHLYLYSLLSFLMIFVPANRAYSVDAWRRPEIRTGTTPVWTLWLMRAQVAIVYFYGGIAKFDSDWLAGATMRTGLFGRSPDTFIGALAQHAWLIDFLTYTGLFFDLLVVPALMWRPTRAFAFLGALVFHLSNSQLWDIGTFPWFMIPATTLFFEPDWPRRLLVRLRGAPAASDPIVEGPAPAAAGRPALLALLGLYLAVQLVAPFRHHLCPGNASWTGEGHRFAWRMMLRVTRGETWFRVTDLASGRRWLVDPHAHMSAEEAREMYWDRDAMMAFSRELGRKWRRQGHARVRVKAQDGPVRFTTTDPETGTATRVDPLDYMTSWQAYKMVRYPDMVLQFAHFLADESRRAGGAPVEVRVETWASLNGRRHQLRFDPRVDLAAEPWTCCGAAWIRPLGEPLPSQRDG